MRCTTARAWRALQMKDEILCVFNDLLILSVKLDMIPVI
ncbi:hypothetical protein NC652_020455 [Populus alba x Populus x berolinensis]|nr:hypothetical protein NC652_020455 [Populus alba x Populus x berolinensis]